MTGQPPSAAFLLSMDQLRAALVERNRTSKEFPGRENYVGFSEVGGCPRAIAHRKLHDEEFPPETAGRMQAGSALENEAIQMVRAALGNAVRETGAAQVEFVCNDAPMRGHPDGRILRGTMDALLASGARIVVLRADGTRGYLDALPSTDGYLEIKTAGYGVLRQLRKGGLNLNYKGQTQAGMGTTGREWGLLVMLNRENLSDGEVVFLEADPSEFEAMKERARRIMAVVDKIRQGLLSDPEGLPDPEEERGYCSTCPCADTCPAMGAGMAQSGASIPAEEIADFEAIAEEYLELQPQGKRFEEVKKLLKERVEALHLLPTTLPSGTLISPSWRNGRVTYDSKKLALFPEVETAARKVGDPFSVITVKGPK